ncbi:tetratricopeptide repeat-containing sulfotransferase family protein [Halofilum ochraceum]|uniref:tetratricopeptide repeat-containing sulfotransferase family protein n=1 Tax=Halofilum ochraceum TaxID=1611323 RepID=UPI000836BAC9|nr:sulfotransferase [Halofilum ochraceum]
MGRSKKGRPAGRQQSATGKKAKPPATPQEAWQQAIAAYEGGKPRQAQNLLAPLLDMPSVPGEVSLLAGLVEAQLGDSRRAEEHLRRAVQLVPERVEGWLGLGNAQHMQGRFDAAVETFRRVLKRSPDNPTALYNMAMAWMDQGRHRDALANLERVLELQPDWPGAEHNRAILLARLGWAGRAHDAYEALVTKNSDDPWLRLEFAGFLDQSNRADEAAAWLPAADAFGEATQGAAQSEGLRAQLLVREARYEEALELLDDAHRRTGEDLLGYRQGNLLDRFGRTDEAMAAFRRGNLARSKQQVANRLRSRKYPEYVAEKIERGILPCKSAEQAAVSDERRTPVFLVGLPRSGTTLLDRMLGAHPETQVLEEFDTLRTAESALVAGRSPAEARQAYWDYVDRHIDVTEGRMVIDKNPLHAPHLDVLPKVFPDARVIIALRHPYDAALSSYMQNFELNPASVHFLDLGSTATLCARLLTMMQLFEQACPEQAIRLRYEDLVTDFQAQVTRVLQGIGLDWHADVAEYAARAGETGMVTTPSYEQVTKGLYSSSIGRWQRYAAWLGPFREEIGPLLPYFGYDEAMESSGGAENAAT